MRVSITVRGDIKGLDRLKMCVSITVRVDYGPPGYGFPAPKNSPKESDAMSRRMDLEMKRVRRFSIEQIKQHLKTIDYKNVPKEQLILWVMSNFDVARRTAREYLEVALAELESEIT